MCVVMCLVLVMCGSRFFGIGMWVSWVGVSEISFLFRVRIFSVLCWFWLWLILRNLLVFLLCLCIVLFLYLELCLVLC